MEITNLTGLEKPAVALIEAMSSATGVLFEPARIKRKAKAEALATVEASKILALGDIENRELVERAANRMFQKAVQQQENIEAVIEDAIPQLENDAKSEAIDKDWMNRFVDGAEQVTDKAARKLWSKILAGEANSPGSYSIRSMNLLKNIGRGEAEMIRTLANSTFSFDNTIQVIVPQNFTDITSYVGLNFVQINELESLGLIKFSYLTGYEKVYEMPDRLTKILIHNDSSGKYFIQPKSPPVNEGAWEYKMKVGVAILTAVGNEMLSLVDDIDRSDFITWASSSENSLDWTLVAEAKSPFRSSPPF